MDRFSYRENELELEEIGSGEDDGEDDEDDEDDDEQDIGVCEGLPGEQLHLLTAEMVAKLDPYR